MKKRSGIFYALLTSILWGIVSPFIKTGLSYNMTPMNFAGLRFTAVGVILLLYTYKKGLFKNIFSTLWENKNLFILLAVVNIFFGYAMYYLGVSMVPAAMSSIIMGTSPFANVLLTHFLIKNDRLNRHKVISIIISTFGVFLVLGIFQKGGALNLTSTILLGVGALYVNILLQGYSAIKLAQHKNHIDPIFLNGIQMFFGGVMLYLAGVSIEGYHNFIGLPWEFYGSLIVLILVSTFGFSFWFIALQDKNAKVSEINMCRMVQPLFGAILSWIMMKNEYPTFSSVSGMLIIMFSLLYYFKGREFMARVGSKKAQNDIDIKLDDSFSDMQK